MSDEIITFALKNTLNEIKNTYPTITNAFFFKNAKTVAADENTDEATVHNAIDALNAIIKRAKAIGGIDAVTFHGTNGKANLTRINNSYLTTITSKETDEKHINTLTKVLVPIALKMVVKIHPASLAADFYAREEPAETQMEEAAATEPETDSVLPKPPVNQFIIENLSSIFASQDTVRIDKEVISQWKKLYPNKRIEKVDAETLNGKTTRCKFKPIKDSKHEGKGIIQMPEKIQHTLQTKKGELVMVKPVIE